MRRYLLLLLVTLIAITAWWLYSQNNRQSTILPKQGDTTKATKPPQPPHPPRVPRPPTYPKTITLLPIAASADSLHSTDTTPEDDLSYLHSLLRAYRRALGTNPVGLNDEITAALTGHNIKGAACLAKHHPAISEKGELLDRWNTPYRFHAYSGKLMEIRSAGPDRKFFSSDDVSLRE